MGSRQAAHTPFPPGPQGLYDPRFEHDACGVGFVVNIKGQRSHALVSQAFEVLVNLLHRGACGCEANTGDGAGMLIQMPDKFLRKVTAPLGITLPAPHEYGVGMVFLPRDVRQREDIQALFEQIVVEEGQRVLGWRSLPSNDHLLGATARSSEPVFKQLFIAQVAHGPGAAADAPAAHARFERKLYVIRKRVEHAVDRLPLFREAVLLRRQPVVEHAHLQGDADRRPDGNDVPGSGRSGCRVGAGAGASAVQHQHVSVLAAGASISLHRPQRRDQHPAGQYQLDAGTRGALPLGRCSVRTWQKVFSRSSARDGSDTATFDNVLEFLVLTGRSHCHTRS